MRVTLNVKQLIAVAAGILLVGGSTAFAAPALGGRSGATRPHVERHIRKHTRTAKAPKKMKKAPGAGGGQPTAVK